MTDKQILPQDFSPAIAVSITQLLMPVLSFIATMVYGMGEETPSNPLLIPGIFTIGVWGCFCYQIITMRKYLRNFGISSLIDKVMLIIPFLIGAYVIASIISNYYYANMIVNRTNDIIFAINNNSSDTTNIIHALEKEKGSLNMMILETRIRLAMVIWILIFVCYVYIATLRKRDFVGGLRILVLVGCICSFVGILSSFASILFFNLSDCILIFILSIPTLYVFKLARRQGNWFGFRRYNKIQNTQ